MPWLSLRGYCWQLQRATTAPSPRSGEGWGEAAALTKIRRDFASSILARAIPLLYTTGKETILAERIENMEYRALGRTGWKISAIGFGAWGIGGNDWGSTDDKTSLAALNQAIDLGVNFIDTADVYGDGHSEQLIAEVRKTRSEEIIVATKAGRRL